jgi:palmitoyltransferase
VFFLLTCFSDPGTITAANVDRHTAAFAFDGLLYAPRRCPTMRFTAPARSKFCRVTNRRVARFDHFCGWMNNAIGENNYRFFLGFLAWHALLCAYGAGLMTAILMGEARATQHSMLLR